MALEHVQPRGNRKVYRRKVPKALQGILGKTEMVLRLGKTDAEVRKQYDATHAEAEQIFAKAWDELHGVKAPAAGGATTGMPALTLDEIRRRDWVATYPTREAALALVDWLKADNWETTTELDRRLAGIGIDWTHSFNAAAERCFEVYGYPELEAVACARRVAEVTTRSIHPVPHRQVAGGSDGLAGATTPTGLCARPEGPQTMTFGFTPRR